MSYFSAATLRHAIDAAAARSWAGRVGVLSMSKIHEKPETLCRWFFEGQPEPEQTERLLEAHLGHVIETDVYNRLASEGIPVQNIGREIISSLDTRYTGHIDGTLGGELLEVMSVREEAFDHIQRTQRLPRRKFLQVQNYLHEINHLEPDDILFREADCHEITDAKVIVLSRERGRCFVIHMPRIESVGKDCEETAREALELIDAFTDGSISEEEPDAG